MRQIEKFVQARRIVEPKEAGPARIVDSVAAKFGEGVDTTPLRDALLTALGRVANDQHENAAMVNGLIQDLFAEPQLSDGKMHNVVVDVLLRPFEFPSRKLYGGASTFADLPWLGVREEK